MAPASVAGDNAIRGSVPVAREVPLSPEAQQAVQSVLGTLRSRESATLEPIAELALAVSRTPQLVAAALAETRAGDDQRARAALASHARQLVELREAASARPESSTAGRSIEAQVGPDLDDLIEALNRSGGEEDQSRREDALEALIGRIQSGQLPVREAYTDSRSPTIHWLFEVPGSEGPDSEGSHASDDANGAEGSGQ